MIESVLKKLHVVNSKPSSSNVLSSSVSVDFDLSPALSLRFLAALRRRTVVGIEEFIDVIFGREQKWDFRMKNVKIPVKM